MTPTELATQWFERVWNQKDKSAIYELMSPSVASVIDKDRTIGPGEFDTVFNSFVAGFPDIRAVLGGTVEQGEEVVVRWTAIGTHSGPFAGIEATGLRVSFFGVSWFRVRDGKMVESGDAYNLDGLINCLTSGNEAFGVRILS